MSPENTLISVFTFSQTDFSSVGEKEITVTYEGKSTSFNVTVE